MTVARSILRRNCGVLLLAALGAALAHGQQAQQAAPRAPTSTPAAPSPDVGPAVDTSGPLQGRPSGGARAPQAPAADAAAASEAAPARTGAPREGAPRRGSRAMDRVELESSQITGNRELPRVLYIVPWRAPAAGDLEGRPVNSLLYELTRPVDRDVFRRENRYFDALQAPSPGADAAAAPGGPEK